MSVQNWSIRCQWLSMISQPYNPPFWTRPAVSANAMLNAVVSHLKGSPTGLKRVVFVLYQDDAYKAFTDTLKRLGGVQ